jgi:hypothetical protein
LTKVLKDKCASLQAKSDALHHDVEKLKVDSNSEEMKQVKQRLRDLKSTLDFFKLQ